MRSFRFLLSRRWLLFALAIVVVGLATWWLGNWQFDRLDDRKERNAVVRANEDKPPAPVADVLAPGEGVAADEEWRQVTATGSYATHETIIVRYRSNDGASGVDVVEALVTADGRGCRRSAAPRDRQQADRRVRGSPGAYARRP